MHRILSAVLLLSSLTLTHASESKAEQDTTQIVVFEIAGENVIYMLDKPVHRGDALGLRDAAIKAAQREVLNAMKYGKSTQRASQMLIAANVGGVYEGKACIYSTGWGSYRIIGCSSKCAGSYCVRVVAQ